jgi:hypothetical protein
MAASVDVSTRHAMWFGLVFFCLLVKTCASEVPPEPEPTPEPTPEPPPPPLDLAMSIPTYTGTTLRVEDFWRETIMFSVKVKSGDGSFKPPSNQTQWILDCIRGNAGVPAGIMENRFNMFAFTRKSGSEMQITSPRNTWLAFVAKNNNDTLRIAFTASHFTGWFTGIDTSQFSVQVIGLTTTSQLDFTVANSPLDERHVRRNGIQVTVALQFNQFKQNDPTVVSIASNHPLLQSLSTSWTMNAASYPASEAVFSLTAQSAFNISTATWLTLTLVSSKLKIDLPVSPVSANLTINSIDNKPLAFCQASVPNITEAELRAAGSEGVNRTISLLPAANDAFRLLPTAEVRSLILGSIPPFGELSITVTDFTTSTVDLNFRAVLGAEYDRDVPFPLSIVLNPRVLESLEAGCGQMFIAILPSPGIVTGRNVTRSVDELFIAEQSQTFEFEAKFDKFVLPTSKAFFEVNSSLHPATATASGAEYFGYDLTVASNAIIELVAPAGASVSDRVRITFLPSARYNIPLGATEILAFTFPGLALSSGLAPTCVNNSANVTGVQPTFTLAFPPLNVDKISVEQLWTYGANLSLTLRGDTWDVDGKALWNSNHPKLDGSITRGEELYAIQATMDRMGGLEKVVDYDNVQISLRTAILPLFRMPGLSLPFDERVRVSKVSQLILGRPTVSQESFILSQVSSSNISISWTGVATSGLLTDEKSLRLGFSFQIVLRYQVFRENATNWLSDLFTTNTSLTPYLANCAAKRDPLWVYNVTCPAMSTFDIDEDELIDLAVPNKFYYEVLPTSVATSSIAIRASPSPVCSWQEQLDVTEGDVRATGFDLVVTATRAFALNVKDVLMTGVVTSTHQDTHPINVSVKLRLNPSTIYLAIERDPSYEINTNDVVTIHLNKNFFTDDERCNSLNFTIRVLPGSGFGTGFGAITAEKVRSTSVVVNITLVGERVRFGSFDLEVSVARMDDRAFPGLPVKGFNELESESTFKIRAVAVTNWTSSAENFTIFQAVIPQRTDFKILVAENLTLSIPNTAVASGVQPILTNVSLIVSPSPSRLNFTFNTTLLEASLTSGTVPPLRFTLLDDYWDTTATPAALLRTIVRRTWAGTPLPSSSTGDIVNVVGATGFSFPSPDVLEIKFVGDESYNAAVDELVLFTFSGLMTKSGIPPAVPNVTFKILAGAPRLIASGSALNAGSRAFITGGLQLDLYLENDIFIRNVLLPEDLCPFAPCVVSVSNSLHRLTVTFLASLTTVLASNATYTVSVKPAAIESHESLNNITMFIRLEPGIATLTFADLPTVVTEDVVSSGDLPTLRINVIGDRLVQNPDQLARALTAGTSCTPVSDAYGFCSRARALFTSIAYRFDSGLQTATLTLQPDELYDIRAAELVNISLGAVAVESGLAPTGWVSILVQPVRGTYQFSATASSTTSADIRNNEALDLEFTFALKHERFTANPTIAMINDGARSTSSDQDEPSGFESLKSNLFFEGSLSDDARVLRLRMKRNEAYAIANTEIITFKVPAAAVVSSNAPVAPSPSTLTIAKSGGTLTLLSPSATDAERVRSAGINVSVVSSDRWAAVRLSGIDAAELADLVVSSAAPSAEPRGYTALKSAMQPTAVSVDGNRLDLTIHAAAGYDLVEREVLTIRFTDPRWGELNRPMTPDHFDIVVVAKSATASQAGYVLLFVREPVSEGALQRQLAEFMGVTTDMVIIVNNVPYGSGQTYRKIAIDIVSPVDTATSVRRSPAEAAAFLIQSDAGLLSSALNISALYAASAPLSESEVNVKLGLQTETKIVHETQSLIWVWVAVAVFCAGCIGAAVLYRFKVRGRMTAARSRDGRAAPLLKLQPREGLETTPPERGASMPFRAASPNDAVALFIASGARAEAIRPSLAAEHDASVDRRLANFTDRDDLIIGPSLASSQARAVRIDLDEYVHSRQPPGFLSPAAAPLQLPALQPTAQRSVGVYPPGTPAAAKFRGRRFDTSML